MGKHITRRDFVRATALAVAAPMVMSTAKRTFAQAEAQAQFEPTAESLKKYECPQWFRDAKFGIWAHWGPQAVPGMGDWYARKLYQEGGADYKYQVEHYGHPSKVGYKDVIPLWKAEKWEPDRLMELYKKAGARYFVAQAVHHDNFDNWDSKYHKWNAVKMGPQKDIVGLWREAALKQGLRFGVSEHLGASYTWFQDSHGADKTGPLAGVPYDGADPKWEDLYHPKAAPDDKGWYSNNPQWHQEWFNRISDVIDHYQPDLLYSDGGIPFGEVGRKLVAHFYNSSAQHHGGKVEAVYNSKRQGSGEYIEGANVLDVERGGMRDIQKYPWQTDTSTGDWFYRKRDRYKTAAQVIHLLADIVSKNGNMLLNVVQLPDGSLPPVMETFVTEMADWMAINGEAIYETRPWKVYGEGPTVIAGGAFRENFPFTADDVRFTSKGSTLYAIALGVPTKELRIKSISKKAATVRDIQVVGSDQKVQWKQEEDALSIQPLAQWPSKHAVSFRIKTAEG